MELGNKDEKIGGNRVTYMDIAKAFAIIFVVIGHSDTPFVKLIYLFHVELFFFISGFFYNDKYSKKPITLITKRLKSLYVPFIGYELLFLCLHNVFFNMGLYSSKIGYGNTVSHLYTTKEFIINSVLILLFSGTEQLLGAFWFIPALFIVTIVFVIISYVVWEKRIPEYYRGLIVVAVCLVGNYLIGIKLFNYFHFSIALVSVAIFYCGYLYRKHEDNIKMSIYIVIISLAVIYMSSFYGSIDIVTNSYTNPIFLIVNSLAGAYVVIYCSKIISSREINHHVIEYIGRHTFDIMALHFLSFKLVHLIQIKIYNLPMYMVAKFPVIDGSGGWWILYSICGVSIPILVIFYVDKLKGGVMRINYHENKVKY